MIELVNLPERRIFLIADADAAGTPASFYLVDPVAAGILINAPAFSLALADALRAVAAPRFLFLPSARGAAGAAEWRDAGLQVIASAEEAALLPIPVDQRVDRKTRLTRAIDFLPMSGRTAGSCALRVKARPGIVFFGPILDHRDWPALVAHPDDFSYENRVIGAIALRDLRFEFALCDNYVHGRSRFGPGAAAATRANLATELRA
ncbi:MAG: hypothetical protein IT515_16150 [Burkholderiales bacterium]|nr:hypothetical protein [Burkholderiales bacterium]